MGSVRPPRKRPFYLSFALFLALSFGVTSWLEGCETIGFYHLTHVDVTDVGARTEADRDPLVRLRQAYVAARDASRARAYPLGAASFVFGIALVILTVGALASRPGARRFLVQVVLVQAAFLWLKHGLSPEVRQAEQALKQFQAEMELAEARRNLPDGGPPISERTLRVLTSDKLVTARLGLRTLVAILIALALTRPRVKQLFEAPDA